jgi:hypothetical protein
VFRVLVAALAVATLAGCSSLTGSINSGLGAAGGTVIAHEALAQPTAGPSGAARIGQCWQLSYSQYLVQPENVGGTVVPCSSAHQAYTYAVVTLDADLQRSLAQPPAFRACQVPYGQIFTQSLAEGRVFLSEVLPSAADWTTGSRLVACTVQTFAIGSSFRTPTLVDLPNFSDFVTAVNSSVAQYSLCVNDPGTDGATGPSLGSAATIADCSTGQWLLEPSPDFPDPAGEAYPGYSGLYPFMHAHCGALYDTATRRGWIFFPSADQWASGDRTFQCWTGAR